MPKWEQARVEAMTTRSAAYPDSMGEGIRKIASMDAVSSSWAANDTDGNPVGLTVIYVRMTSETWLADEEEVDRAIDGAVDRVMTRPLGSDNAVSATDASSGVYVDTASATSAPIVAGEDAGRRRACTAMESVLHVRIRGRTCAHPCSGGDQGPTCRGAQA